MNLTRAIIMEVIKISFTDDVNVTEYDNIFLKPLPSLKQDTCTPHVFCQIFEVLYFLFFSFFPFCD